MKYILSLLAVISVAFCSCESNSLFLKEDPRGRLFPDNFLNNVTELEMMNTALYESWRTAIIRPYESFEIKLASSDDIIGTGNQRIFYNEMEVNMDITPGADNDIMSGWDRAYVCINRANAIINNYQNALGSASEAEVNSYAAQARFIRAYMYFWLVRFFNKVPLITDAFIPDEKRTVTLASGREIYDLIVSDLEFAEQWLPVQWTGFKKEGGAVTKGAAKTILASVYLQMAGFPLNGGAEFYAKARDKAKEVIDNAGTYGYALRTHYWEVWDPNWKAFQIPQDEIIMWLECTVNDYNMRAPNPSRPIEFSGWESMIAELGFFRRFPEGERKEFTFITDFYHSNGQHYHYTDLQSKHPSYRKLWADDLTPGWEWENRNDPTSKWRSGMDISANWFSSRPVIITRYPEVLLTYAEAKARIDGPDDLAYKCLNDVRNRAFKGVGTTEASVSGLTKEQFIDAVVWERAYEFAGFEYCARWFDLQRLELVEKATTEWREETEEKYQIRTPYTKKHYFLPIPSMEVQLNPNLAGNTDL